MKKFLLLFVALLSMKCAEAQVITSAPILEDGKSWKWQHVSAVTEEDNEIFIEEVIGDTIVEGRACKLIKSTWIKTYLGSKQNSVYAAYEEDGKVYHYNDYYKVFFPMLDVGLTFGQSTPFVDIHGKPLDNGRCLTVVGEDYIEVCGKVRRRLLLDDGLYHFDDTPKMYWVEGIGENTDLSHITVFAVPSGWLRFEMLECHKDGELIFTREDFDAAPCSMSKIEVDDRRSAIYDLKGIKRDRPAKGLNVIDGKLTFCR